MKKGTKVIMVDCPEAEKYTGRIWTTRSEPWKCCGSEVVLLEGYSGGFDVSKLKEWAIVDGLGKEAPEA